MTGPRHALRLRILAGAAASALMAGTALAQATPPTPPASTQPKPPPGPTYISADRADRDGDGNLQASGHVSMITDNRTVRADKVTESADGAMVATGNVEAVTVSPPRAAAKPDAGPQRRSIRADSATFDPNTAIISAHGQVRMYQPDGTVEFADSMIFTQDMETGVATNFSAHLAENATIAAANIVRRDENHTEMNRAIFTTCSLCNADGSPKNPTWQISADKVVRDETQHAINFQNAWIKIGGVSLIPLPFFSIADPDQEQKSGLLSPDFQHTERRGLTYDQPYLWAISPYQDLVITPQINTQVNPFVSVDWRKRFYSGQLEVLGGYTYERDFNTSGLQFGPDRSKAYVFADGEFKLSPEWNWGFTAETVRDRRVFDQYSLEYTPPDRGLFEPNDRRLISQLYTVRQGDQSYLSIAALGFQSLRALPLPPNSVGLRPLEDDNTLPFVGPLVEFRYDPDTMIAGGRFRLTGSGVALSRNASPLTGGAPGVDSSRATIEANWRSALTLSDGIRIEPFADARADYYQTGDFSLADTATHNNSRSIATAGADLSWPFVRASGSVTTTVEPIIQVAVSPQSTVNPQIPDEDSLALQLDDTNLFDFNRAPGFDLYESGNRLSAGVRTTIDWGEGHNARLLVGQTFRNKPDPSLPVQSGLAGTSSDWVFDGEVTPVSGLYLFARGRLDNWDLRHVEVGVDAQMDRATGYLRYMRTDQDYTGSPAEDIEGQAQVFIAGNWGILANATRDLEEQQWRRRSIGAVYRDDCLRFELLYQRDNNPLLGARDSSSIVFRLTLVTLGDTGYNNSANRRPGER